MHTWARTVASMGRINESSLTTWLAGQGVIVVEVDGGDHWGWYDRQAGSVALRQDLLPFQRVPILMHECYHVARDDDGQQTPRVEEWIDEQVAGRLISLPSYAAAEEAYGWNSGAIAAELDVPRWVVQAYRRSLERTISDVLATA